ncbi:hypothetical protein C8Q73DRAFT_804956 [Cubamyces lactineus]|nr:hypothetical protein C8Q73DRAFT_804956 [Cubamyces lactineus]
MAEIDRTHQLGLTENSDELPCAQATRPSDMEATAVMNIRVDPNSIAQIMHILRDFLFRLGYNPPHTPVNTELRSDLAKMVDSWNLGISKACRGVAATIESACLITECAYGHIPYREQLLVASYTALVIFVDDLKPLDALQQVGRWVATGEKVTNIALEQLLLQIRKIYDHSSHLVADCINVATLDGLLGHAIEFISEETNGTVPQSALYAEFIRRKTGYGIPYALFNFIKAWQDASDLRYLLIAPAMERYINGINFGSFHTSIFLMGSSDLFSFYKETLKGETSNYVYLSAAAQHKSPYAGLQSLADDIVATVRNMRSITSADPQLAEICEKHLMGFLEFHIKDRRYRLDELQLLQGL